MTRYAVAGLAATLLATGAGLGEHPAARASTTAPGDDDAATSSGTPLSVDDVRPRPDALVRPLASVDGGRVVDPERLRTRLREEVGSSWLGPSAHRAITIRDARTGEHLYDKNADLEVTPASTTKLLSAAAIVTALDPSSRFTTKVVQGAKPQQVVIVAGGDMLLGDGKGEAEAVAGHGGIGDLAAQTAAALKASGVSGPIEVQLDLSHVEGASVLDTWSEEWVAGGYTGRVVQLGRQVDRALVGYAAPAAPEQQVARVFRSALADEGVRVKGAARPTSPTKDVRAREVTASDGATELAKVESAPVRDVLALALATSDNALVEQLARQAADAAGERTDRRSVAAWVEKVVADDYGVDTTGVRLADASGLSNGTRIPVRVVADVLVAGADGQHRELQDVLGSRGLPIAGWTGTLHDRFQLPVHSPAVGIARAKTGSLPGVTSLAGIVVTADGRLLVYAMTADQVQDGSATIEARAVLDEVVAELARCGCSA